MIPNLVDTFDPYLSCRAEIKEVELTFGDGEKKIFDASLLSFFPFFKTWLESSFKEQVVGKIKLKNYLKEHVELLIELFYNNQHLSNIINDETLVNPEFYEEMESSIRFFLAGDAEAALVTIKEELRSLPYPLALSLLKNYRSQKTKDQEPPFYFSTIENLVSQIMFFKNPDRYEDRYLLLLREKQVAIALNLRSCRIANQMIQALTEEKKNCLSAFANRVIYSDLGNEGCDEIKDIYSSRILKKENEITKLHFEIGHIEERVNPKKLTPSKLFILSHPMLNEGVTAELKLSKRYWKIYKEKVLDCLQYMRGIGAKMHKRVLLSPKLFAYYDLVPHMYEMKNGCSNAQFACQNYIKTWYFLGEGQESLLQLEEEILGDFFESGIPVPERPFVDELKLPVLKEAPFVKEEIQALKKRLLPYFRNTKKCEEESFAEKNLLINKWNWDEFEITPKDIQLIILPSDALPDEDMVRVSGTLFKFGKSLRFFFALDAFEPIILSFDCDPTPQATYSHLKLLYQNQKNNLKSHYNFFQKTS